MKKNEKKKIIKIQVVLTEKMHVYHERSNSGYIFGSVPLRLYAKKSISGRIF